MSDQVQFAPLEPSNGAGPGDAADLERLYDVTVELALALGPGSVVTLDRLADKPVDLLVNGKPIARGEVVVIDEEFGLRITEVASPRHGRPDAA
jgi:flagellar motor switch protein FliN